MSEIKDFLYIVNILILPCIYMLHRLHVRVSMIENAQKQSVENGNDIKKLTIEITKLTTEIRSFIATTNRRLEKLEK